MPSPAPTDPALLSSDRACWVVAIGASAGGLEALQQFFAALGVVESAAFVVLQHLAPDHRSMMAELLARHTRMPVREAGHAQALATGCVHLLPPGVQMSVEGHRFAFEDKPAHGVPHPIDVFFLSIARSHAERAVAVVLSGSGSDGSHGAAAVREAGGFVMVQSIDSARFDGMPRSAGQAVSADAVGTPEDLARQVRRLVEGAVARVPGQAALASPLSRPAMHRLFEALLAHSGINFADYKAPTVLRRVERRMAALELGSAAEYADRVAADPVEREALKRELLIPVTGFFRDADAFETLRTQVIEPLVRSRADASPLRIWCAGCATGEEAYSVAMLALRACKDAQSWPGVKVFASDVDQRFLDAAAAGVYPRAAAEGVPAPLLKEFFVDSDDRIAVRPELRQTVLFARHNLLVDAPFTRMDLVVCRNTLIYFQVDAQERALRRMQYALKARGTLFLGASESLGVLQSDFDVIDERHKLFRVLRPVANVGAMQSGIGFGAVLAGARRRAVPGGDAEAPALVDQALQSLHQRYMPLSLLVNDSLQLVHAWGPTQQWLRVNPGAASTETARMLPADLAPLAAQVIRAVLREGTDVRRGPAPIALPDGSRVAVLLHGSPLRAPAGEAYALLSVEVQPAAGWSGDGPGAGSGASAADNALLESELAEMRHNLQATITELEATNEELQATNEELMSSNEELQSTNEELQSVNEELYTVNAEYNAKLEALNAMNADLESVCQSTGIATLFLDAELALKRFTPEAMQLFRLRESDLGRPLTDLASLLRYPELGSDLQRALQSNQVIEREVQGAGQWYLARAVGYAEHGHVPRRVVVSFIDISLVRDAKRLQGLIDSVPARAAVLDPQGSIRMVNRAWVEHAQTGGDPTLAGHGVGVNYLATLARSGDESRLYALRRLQAVLEGREKSVSLRYPDPQPDGSVRWALLHAAALVGAEPGVVVCHLDASLEAPQLEVAA